MSNSEHRTTGVPALPKQTGSAEDPLELLRHNQTYTLPPGGRMALVSHKLEDLPPEHLRSTDDLDRRDLDESARARMHAADSATPLPQRKRLIVACAVGAAFLGTIAIYSLTREPPQKSPEPQEAVQPISKLVASESKGEGTHDPPRAGERSPIAPVVAQPAVEVKPTATLAQPPASSKVTTRTPPLKETTPEKPSRVSKPEPTKEPAKKTQPSKDPIPAEDNVGMDQVFFRPR